MVSFHKYYVLGVEYGLVKAKLHIRCYGQTDFAAHSVSSKWLETAYLHVLRIGNASPTPLPPPPTLCLNLRVLN